MFIHYSQAIDHVYENLEDYGPTKKRRVSIVFDEIGDTEANKKLSPKVTELFYEKENWIFPPFLYHNLISKCLKLQD